jgi:predicted amidohydrolase YtcJ
LETGKLADFIITDKNPLTAAPHELSLLNVEQTFVDGKCVYRK